MITPLNAESNASSDASKPTCDLIYLSLLLAFPSTGFIQKYAGLAGTAAYVLFVAIVLYLTTRFRDRFTPWCQLHFRGLAVLVLAGLAACFVFLHPIEDGRGPGKSSDRDEGLNLAVTRMAEGKTPYYPSDPFAGPLSVLPGSIVLAAPFVALGESGYQNLLWLAVFLVVSCRFFRSKTPGLVLTVIPLAVSPAAMYEFVSGGDMLANGIFVPVFFLLALKSWVSPDAPVWSAWLACALLGVGLASRSNFLLLLPLFGAVLWRETGFRNAIAGTGIAALVAVAITLPFYLHDPAGFTPLLAKQKLAIVDHALPWASKAMIGMTALTAMVGALTLLRRTSVDPIRDFFRWCTLVTLCPMICAVSLFSMVNGHLDFGFMRDRFGLMYVFFAILGWGGQWFKGRGCAPPSDQPGYADPPTS